MSAVQTEFAPELIERVEALFVGAPHNVVLDASQEGADEDGKRPFAISITEKTGIDILTGAVWKLEKHSFMVERPDGTLGEEKYASLFSTDDQEAVWVLDLDTGELESSEEVQPYPFGQAARFAIKLAVVEHFDVEFSA